MYNLVRADLFKLCKSNMLKILFCIMTVCAVIVTVMAYLIGQEIIEAVGGFGFLFADVNTIGIIGAVVGGALICGDFENKTIHDAIATGHSRGKVILSKSLVFFLAIFILLLPYMAATFIALMVGGIYTIGFPSLGFLNLLINTSSLGLDAHSIVKLILISLILVIVYIGQLSICIPLAIKWRKPIPVLATSYVLSIVSGQLLSLAGQYPIFERIFALTPFGGNHIFLTLDSSIADFIQAVVISVGFSMVMIYLANWMFKKSEIK